MKITAEKFTVREDITKKLFGKIYPPYYLTMTTKSCNVYKFQQKI